MEEDPGDRGDTDDVIKVSKKIKRMCLPGISLLLLPTQGLVDVSRN